MALGGGSNYLFGLPDPWHASTPRTDPHGDNSRYRFGYFVSSNSTLRIPMTAEEEQNMWSRLMKLEEQIAQVIDALVKLAEAPRVEEGVGGLDNPPRDRYGDSVGRPEM
jgi:hypothetical protein